MAGYWKSIPIGVWRTTDVVDAINAVNDPESRFAYDVKHDRLHVFGPPQKVVWVDLQVVRENAEDAKLLLLLKLTGLDKRT